jgi:hypothetical protein
MATYYGNFVRRFGKEKYQRIANTVGLVFRPGEPQGAEYRQRAEAATERNYQASHEKIASLGGEALGKLPVDEDARLIDDESKYKAFLFDQGLQTLPVQEWSRIEAHPELMEFETFIRYDNWSSICAYSS